MEIKSKAKPGEMQQRGSDRGEREETAGSRVGGLWEMNSAASVLFCFVFFFPCLWCLWLHI